METNRTVMKADIGNGTVVLMHDVITDKILKVSRKPSEVLVSGLS